jgi:hypothetical protein
MIYLSSSSDEEDFFADTSRDEDFARRLFDNLNRDLLGPPGDGKVIILSDSDEEVEACEETTTTTDAAPSVAVKSSTPTASTADVDEDPGKMQNANSDDLAPGQNTDKSSGDGDEAGLPYAVVPRMAHASCLLQGELHSALLPYFLFCAEEL